MRLQFDILLLAFSVLTSALPPQRRSVPLASFEGLTHNTRDRSGRRGDPPRKYFHESTFDAHYDGRFASTPLPSSQRQPHLRALVKTYLSTMHALGAETWIMHGSLLGWWWNRRIMPWDSDIDVQVSEASLAFLAQYYNMTVHTFRDLEVPVLDDGSGKEEEQEEQEGRKKVDGEAKSYLLEINPHWTNGDVRDTHNVIDARWIDTATGLFIDITALRVNHSSPAPLSLYCKDTHRYLSTQIFPLRTSVFEHVPVRIPYAYQALLAAEYGEDALVNTEFQRHRFDQASMEWRPVGKLGGSEQEKLEEEKWRARGRKPGRRPLAVVDVDKEEVEAGEGEVGGGSGAFEQFGS